MYVNKSTNGHIRLIFAAQLASFWLELLVYVFSLQITSLCDLSHDDIFSC